MTETIFRTPSVPTTGETVSTEGVEPEPNIWGTDEDLGSSEPVENYEQATLQSLGIDDSPSNLSEEDKYFLTEASQFLLGIIKEKGLSVSQKSFNRVLGDLKYEMDIDIDAEPSVVLNRIGGVASSWRDIGFIKDPKERRSLFMKLSRLQSSNEMNRLVFEEMEKRKIYR